MNKWYKFSLIAIVLVLVFYLLLPSNDSDTSKLNEVVNKEVESDKKILSKKNKESRTSLTYKINNIKNIEVDESAENIKDSAVTEKKPEISKTTIKWQRDKNNILKKRCVPDLSGGPIGIIKNILSGKKKCLGIPLLEKKENGIRNVISLSKVIENRLKFFIAEEFLNINISSASQLSALSCLEKTKIDDVVKIYEDNILEWEELFKIPLSDKRWQEKKDEVNAIIDGKTYEGVSESNNVCEN